MKQKVAVLGGGVTGLAAAYRLVKEGYEVHVIEKESEVGGTCRSFKHGEFTLDYGPHKFYTLLDGVLEDVQQVMGDELIERDKSQSIFLDGKYFGFPFRMGEMIRRFSPIRTFKILSSYALQIMKNPWIRSEAISYRDFVVRRFGKGLYEQVLAPLARKIYGPPEKLDSKLAEVRISSSGLMDVLKQVLFPKVDRTKSAPTFHYPKGGFGRIPEKYAAEIQALNGTLHTGATVTELNSHEGKINEVCFKRSDGSIERLAVDHVVFTIPMSLLPRLAKGLPQEVNEACSQTKFRHVVIAYYLLKKENLLPSMWTFFPEKKFRFGRLSEMNKFSPQVSPKGCSSLMVDFTCDPDDEYWKMTDDEIKQKLDSQLSELGLFEKKDEIAFFTKRVPNFYPVYDIGFVPRVKTIRKVERILTNLYFIGRLGDFNYNNSDQCIDMGYKVAEHIIGSGEVNSIWESLRVNTFDQYRIVD